MHFSFLSRDPETFLPQLGQQAGATVHSDSFEKVLIVLAEAIVEDLIAREVTPVKGLELSG